jgi:hypothetical protein
MPTVVGQHNPAGSRGEGKDSSSDTAAFAFPAIKRSLHIVAKAPEVFDNLQRDVLVGIEAGH